MAIEFSFWLHWVPLIHSFQTEVPHAKKIRLFNFETKMNIERWEEVERVGPPVQAPSSLKMKPACPFAVVR